MTESTNRFRPKACRIGGVSIDPPLILAPMAGITDSPYRSIMADFGAGLVTTEMVSIQGLVRSQPETLRLCTQHSPLRAPLSVQLFGNDPDVMAEAALRVEGGGAAIIDINAGCPVKKVARQGAGATLMKDPERLARLVEAVKKAVSIPVTVKVRIGWDEQSLVVVEVARMLESAGVDAICVHGRTAVQHYSGKADWSWIRRVKEAVRVPVIGNGDVTSPQLAEKMLRRTGCDAVMIGRASQGNPWLFSTIAAQWGVPPPVPPDMTWKGLMRTALHHVEVFGRERSRSSGHFRKLLIWYSRGCPESASFRWQLSTLQDPADMVDAFEAYIKNTERRGIPFLSMKVPDDSDPIIREDEK